MADTKTADVMAEGHQVVNVVPGFGSSCAVPGLDWPAKWRGTMQLQMNYTEFFYEAVKTGYGAKDAMDIYMDAHIMQGRLTGEIFKKTLEAQKKELNVYNFVQLVFTSSQLMGETFYCYQRPDGVYVYFTVNEPHARLFMKMAEGATPQKCFERCMAWWLPALAYYNPNANIAWLTNCYEHGYCSFAAWDPDVTPAEPIEQNGGDAFCKFGKIPETVKGKSWGPFYLRKPYIREGTVEPPPVNSSYYGRKPDSPCA